MKYEIFKKELSKILEKNKLMKRLNFLILILIVKDFRNFIICR